MHRQVQQCLCLVIATWLQAISGTNFDFSAYSTQMKQILNVSQLHLNLLASASDAGKFLGWSSGFAAHYLPLWLVLLVGALLGLVGYGIQYLFVSSVITSLSYSHIFLLTVLAGNSICWINTVCYILVIRSFTVPSDCQVAVGLTTSYQGLTPNIFADVVNLFAGGHSSKKSSAESYLFLNAVVPTAVSAFIAPFVRVVGQFSDTKSDTSATNSRVGVFFSLTVVIGLFAVVSSLGVIPMDPTDTATWMGLLLVACPVIILTSKIMNESSWWRRKVQLMKIHDGGDVHHVGLTGDSEGAQVVVVVDVEKMESKDEDEDDDEKISQEEGGNGVVTMEKCSDQDGIIRVREEVGMGVMVQRLDFWLYFGVYLFGATLGIVYTNNLGQIAESRGSTKTAALVSLSSAFSFFGRLLPSLLDYLLPRRKYMVSRPGCMVMLVGPMAVSFFMLLSSSTASLYISTATIGACTGAITSIAICITKELFGTNNFGVNHNVVVANIPIGSITFGYVAALLYQREGDGDGSCIGTKCYRNSFILWGTLSLVGTFLATLLFLRTRKFYNSQISSSSSSLKDAEISGN